MKEKYRNWHSPSAFRRDHRVAHGVAVGKRVIKKFKRWRRDTLAHTLVQNYIHVVFSTKDRRKSIPKEHQQRLWRYIVGICKNEGLFVYEIGGMEDHVHLLIKLPPTLALSDAILTIKGSSSKWMGRKFAWQRGFGAFSVSASNLNTVVRYIRNQEAHHRKMTFDEEFIALLKKHGVEFDLKYVLG